MCIARDNLVNNDRELNLNQQPLPRQPSQFNAPNNWMQSMRKPLKPKHATRKLVLKAKINLNKYWHKFEEILSAAGEDIKSMSTNYTEFLASQKYKYSNVEAMSSDLLNTTKLTLLSAVRNQTPNNLREELNNIVSKNSDDEGGFVAAKNINESASSYTAFSNDDLYYGVNLSTNIAPMSVFKAKRCSCYLEQEHTSPPPQMRKRPASTSFLPSADLFAATSMGQSPAKFNHRNIRLSIEDCQNLENEALRQAVKYSKSNAECYKEMVREVAQQI